MANKDYLDGRNEVLGGPDHEGFWRAVAAKWDGDFKEKQRYGALTVIKRRWDKTWLPSALGLAAREWVPDTSYLAQLDKDIESDSEDAQSYYAVLMMDGDDLGQWLSGEKSGAPVSEQFHRGLSRKLASFALDRARPIVKGFGGHLLYSGGDDALAMLPAARALGCAHALVSAFREILPGAGASAGIAIGHVRSPMQDTIQAAREAERTAKKREGKDAVCFVVRKRSGEGVAFTAPWSSGAVAVWRALDERAAQFSHALAHDYGARLEALLIESGSATGASIAKEWRAPLEDIAEAELRHVLRRQGRLNLTDATALAAEWRAQLIPALAPRDFLHFWLAWAFIRRLPPEKTDTAP
jgi:CRISPR-associated protein Cmr2